MAITRKIAETDPIEKAPRRPEAASAARYSQGERAAWRGFMMIYLAQSLNVTKSLVKSPWNSVTIGCWRARWMNHPRSYLAVRSASLGERRGFEIRFSFRSRLINANNLA